MDLVLTKPQATKYINKISKFAKLVCKVRKQVKICLKFFSSSKIPVQIWRGGSGPIWKKFTFWFFFFWKASLSSLMEIQNLMVNHFSGSNLNRRVTRVRPTSPTLRQTICQRTGFRVLAIFNTDHSRRVLIIAEWRVDVIWGVQGISFFDSPGCDLGVMLPSQLSWGSFFGFYATVI